MGEITVDNPVDSDGLPVGGTAKADGFTITWATGDTDGAELEDVLAAVEARLDVLNSGPLTGAEYQAALNGVRAAVEALEARAARAPVWEVPVLPASDEVLAAQRAAEAADSPADEPGPVEPDTTAPDPPVSLPGDSDFTSTPEPA